MKLGEYDTTNEGSDCVEVDGGGLDCTDGAISINIDKVIPHPHFDLKSQKNDIGLIRLSLMAPFTGNVVFIKEFRKLSNFEKFRSATFIEGYR